MATTQAIWGIDLGRCALKAIKLRIAADDKVEIVAYDYVEHAKILSQPDADRHELISQALEKFLSRNDISKDEVVVGVPGQHTLARFTKLPPVATKRIPDIVRYEADQQIPFDMDEVIWDYQTFQPEGSPDLEVGIFAMKRELIREHLLHFEQASIEPIAVQSGPLAVYNGVNFDGKLGKETTVILDIGAENTDLIIATPETFWTRTVPIGGNKFTEALVKSFKLSFSKAESLKRTADSSKYARQIFQAMRPVFADLVQELQRSIGFYSSTHRDTHVDRVLGLGNAFKLPGLKKYLQQNLGLPVECPDSFSKVASAGKVNDPEFKEEFLSFWAAFGLAVQGLDLAYVNSNLLPAEIAKAVVWRKKRPAFAAAAACLVLAGGLVWFRQSSDMKALAADDVPPRIANVDDAWDIIERGPSQALSDGAQAKAILAAGKYLKSTLSDRAGSGELERVETEELILIQKNKAVIPKILGVVHRSVPMPQGALGEATTQTQVRAALNTPRRQRNQVFLDRLLMHYEQDVNLYEWESVVDVEDPINDSESVLPAVKLEIHCRTPNDGGLVFFKDSFMAALRENGRKPGLGFYFDRVYLYDGGKVVSKTARGGAGKRPARGRGRGLGSTGIPGVADPSTSPENVRPEDVDPITLEAMSDDWRFEVWVDVILEDYPFYEGDEPEEED